jgi:DNA (cytosine-5)-methyltransferase 1
MPKIIDLFAGAGGFSHGFKLAGYDVSMAIEIDKWAAETLKVNNPSTKVILGDIRLFQKETEIKTAINNENIDVIIGGPPCQGFSVAGPKKDPKDPRNSLFIDFSRWVENLQPQMFVMENVKGLLARHNGDGEKVIDIIKNRFLEIGYHTTIWALNAAFYGVPQSRERIFIVGNKKLKEIDLPPITHYLSSDSQKLVETSLLQAVTVGDAILDLPVIDSGEGYEEMQYTMMATTDYQKWARENQKILHNHVAMKHTNRVIERFKQITDDSQNIVISEEYAVKKRNGNGSLSDTPYHMNNRRISPGKPSFTIPASFYSTFIHPYQHRNITAREAARLQSFPDSYRFMGKRTVISSKLLTRQQKHEDNFLSQYNQIGNAVPPLLAKAIATHILSLLSETEPSK